MKYDSTTLLLEKQYTDLSPAERRWADAEFGGAEGYAEAAAALAMARAHVQAAPAPPDASGGWAGVAASLGVDTPWWKRPVPLYQVAAAALLLLLLGWWWGRGDLPQDLPEPGYLTVVDTVERLERVVDTVYLQAVPGPDASQELADAQPGPQRQAPSPPRRKAPSPKLATASEPGFLPAAGAGHTSGLPGGNLAVLRSQLEAEFGGITSESQAYLP